MLAAGAWAQSPNKVLILNQGGYVQVPSAPSLQDSSAITVEAWLYPVENGVENPVFLSKGDFLNGTSDQAYWLSWSRFPGAAGRSLSFNLFLGNGTATKTWANITAGNVASNSWVHLAVTFESAGGALTLYTNGVLASRTTVDAGGNPLKSMAVRQSGLPLILGYSQRPIASDIRPAGAMDEVRVWSRPLSAAEVLAEYRCASVNDASLEARWSFDTGTVNDDTGKGHNGVLGGGATLGNWVGAGLLHADCQTPRAAQGKATVVNGFVVGVEITDGGWGYQSEPQVHLLGGGGSGATGVATVQNGIVTGVRITSAGSGYSSPPRVLIAAPPAVPFLRVVVKQVEIQMNVTLGFTYKLQRTSDLTNWTDVGPAFLATESTVFQTVEVTSEPGIFRIVQVP